MSQSNHSIPDRKGKHLLYEERVKIEALQKIGINSTRIAEQLGGRSERTIRRELQKGKVILLNSDLTERESYSAEIGQQKHDVNATAKGPALKIGRDHELVAYLEKEIGENSKSPYAALQGIENGNLKFETSLCVKSVYNYLDNDLFLKITNKDLPVKKTGKKRNHNKIRKALTNIKGTSIADRPKEVDKREETGHWEMDTVVGAKGTKNVLLVLSERVTRKELIFKMESKSQAALVNVLDKLEKKLGTRFANTFKTITCDNGCENLDFESIERSALRDGYRTKVYYAHPYSAWERGTNENINKMIRRFIPKGADISKYTKKEIKRIEHWINNYPRKILKGLSANMFYESYVAA
jgi:transposase, IS30 family